MRKKNKCLIILVSIWILALLASVWAIAARGTEFSVFTGQNKATADGVDPRETSPEAKDDGHPILLTQDIEDLEIHITDETEARAALTQVQGVFNDPQIAEHAEIQDVQKMKDSVFYRFECTYEGIPVWGESIIMVADQEQTVCSLVSNYYVPDMVIRTDVLDAVMAESGVLTFAENWLTAQSAEEQEETLDLTIETISGIDPERRVFFPITRDTYMLAYTMDIVFSVGQDTVYSFEVLISASTGEVLDCVQDSVDLYAPVAAYNGDGSEQVPAVQEGGVYHLRDEKLDITILNAAGMSHSQYDPPDYHDVTSANPYFGDTQEEKDAHYDKAVKLMQILQDLRSFYEERFSDPGFTGGLFGVYDDGYQFGNNMSAGGYLVPTEDPEVWHRAGVLYVGTNRDYDQLETFGHEYGHLIQKEHFYIGERNDAGPISEGTADIMGVLYESIYTGKAPDWIVAEGLFQRDLSKNGSLGNDFGNAIDWIPNTDTSHMRATYFSHAAYLMYTAPNDAKTSSISNKETLMELWYRTIMLLPESPTFEDGRAACEAAARQMIHLGSLKEKEYNSVVWAFDQIGIGVYQENLFKTIFGGGNIEVEVLTADGGNSTDYTLVISTYDGKEIQRTRKDSVGHVTASLAVGRYILTAKDNKEIWADAHAYVTVAPAALGGTDKKIHIKTSFGTTLEGWVEDETGARLQDVRVRVYSLSVSDQDGYDLQDHEGYTGKDGYYFFNIRPGLYRMIFEKEGYTKLVKDFVRITAGKNIKEHDDETVLRPYAVLKKVEESLGYAEIIRQKEEEFGHFRLEHTGWCYMSGGVNYLQLIDLDGDGSRELILGHLDQSGSYANTPLEIWTMKDGAPTYLGSVQVMTIGVDISEIFIAYVNGKLCIFSGKMISDGAGYSLWTYDGSTLVEVESGLSTEEIFDLRYSVTPETSFVINCDPSYPEAMEELFDQICSVKEELGMETDEFPSLPERP